MDPTLKSRVEIETLHEILPELDYYRLLRVEPMAAQAEIEPAFRRESRRLHPDRYSRIGDSALMDQVNDIYRVVNEAYRTLKDPDTRARYDQDLSRGNKRMTAQGRTAAAQDAAAATSLEHAARTPKGEKYWKMALKCWEDKDWKGCVIQINFALTFEPDNATFKEWLEKAKSAHTEHPKEKENLYKLRIV